MQAQTFFWHDYETTGTDSRRDRPMQFAGVRTDADLRPLGEPIMLYCQPAAEVLPHPRACLITGITPQHAQARGVPEREFAATIHEALAQPGTCGVGYNSLRFDDEFTRHLLYRNFYDPYAREWQHGNSRWDLIDLARMCYALRPEGLQWALREDGSPSFRLQDLATANDLPAGRAHDAMSDVESTLALARAIRAVQPRLFDWHKAMRRKRHVQSLIDIAGMTPLLHVSQRYPAQQGCLAMVAPVAEHPGLPNAVLVVDLDCDPDTWTHLDADAIADRVFTPRADLPEDVQRVPLKQIRINRCPALAPLSVLQGVDTARIGLDVERCLEHLEHLRAADGVAEKLRQVAARDALPAAEDAELALYDRFLGDAERPLLAKVRAAPAQDLAAMAGDFHDPRYRELLFRYRARNWPDSLNLDEQARWSEFQRARLNAPTALTTLTLGAYFALIAELRADATLREDQRTLLDQLELWGRERAADYPL